MAAEKNNGKPLKQKFWKFEKQNVNLYQFWASDYKDDHIQVICCVICR